MRPRSIILLHKPFGVLCRFTDPGGRPTLRSCLDVPGVYPCGRLDADSEGLVVLTDDGALQHQLSHPRFGKTKDYLVQVDGAPDDAAIRRLVQGVVLADGPAKAVAAQRIDEPAVGPRDPPIRVRQSIPTTWLRVTLDEGRNRQVRRMTASIGHPTLRLVRVRVGPYTLDDLPPGGWRRVP